MYKQRGMTLVELVTVVAIIGILAAIAIPSYTSYTRKTRRADAKVELTKLAQQLERCYTRFNTYTPATACIATLPYNTVNKDYTIDADTAPAAAAVPAGVSANAFALKATPINAQVKDTYCGTFQLNSLNMQTVTSGATDCW